MKRNTGSVARFFIDPATLLVVIIASIFSAEALVNLMLSIAPPFSPIKFALLDSAMLIIILFPVIYFLVFRPFRLYIEELKLSEEALQVSEEKYRSLVETTDDSIYVVSKNCTYVFMNTKHRLRLGFSGDEYRGRPYSDFHSSEETRDFHETVSSVFETGKSLQCEHRSTRDLNSFLRTLSPIKGLHGEIVAVSVVSKNITSLKKINGEKER